jgi:hypothetical protein
MVRRVRFRTVAALAICLLAGKLSAQQLQAPTNADLLSAYCLSVLDEKTKALEASKLPEHMSPMFQRAIQRNEASMQRIRGFLVPRLAYLDVLGLVTAKQQGSMDVNALKESIRSCMTSCKPGPDQLTCFNACDGDKEIGRRVGQCESAAFLPY